MPIYYDQLNREINLPEVPKRIISIVPSQTELLFYLGLDEEIIGITKFCIHPAEKFKSTTKIGGTKQLDIGKIKSLQPDLIIANKEENERSQLEELMQYFPVWISDIYDLPGALEMVERVGVMVNRTTEANDLSNEIIQKFIDLKPAASSLRVAYFIWRKPYMVTGQNTFIDSMLQQCGLTNAFDVERYPEVDEQSLIESKPDVILLSSEPYPFKEKHINELQRIVPSATIKLVDGEMFSWYGSRLLEAPAYFTRLISELN
ncbi:helical backbone metal receptor [Mucilaginibacter sp. BJC16-A38]|uniref:helical backbone metal receptor n=1 Tax=Mucilaginibacter phenanthrenivorans TaxID=1234842 RepID=UPI002157144A|nr:helical backbone metal receptor [Mucilaginibacter phenanthrenivorans]MCR8556740.1 helical backbone metal receptor [Mucilaginibacter phenanthrenivorans]